jgi:hypothetical protein
MKINLGKSLSRKEMKSILGGATASCTPQGGIQYIMQHHVVVA